MGKKNNAYKVLVGKVARPPGIPTRRCENNIKMDLTERGWGAMDWIHLAQDTDEWRALNIVMNLLIP
jgi:hypothetical protein